MKSYFELTPEARHAIKCFDLEYLEILIGKTDDREDKAAFYEKVFYEIRKRKNVKQSLIIDWIERFIAWLEKDRNENEFSALIGTDWAYEMIAIGDENNRLDLTLKCLNYVIDSEILLESEQRKWDVARSDVYLRVKNSMPSP